MYLLHIKKCDTFAKADGWFGVLRGPAALLKFADGTGGIALLDRRPMFCGQRKFDGGQWVVKRNYADPLQY